MNSIRKIILLSVAFGIIVLLLFVFIAYPLLEQLQEISEELIVARKELVLSKGEIEKSEQIKKVYQKIESDIDKIDQLFVNPEVPVDLIEFWERTAENSNLAIKITPVSLRVSEQDQWNSMGFQINTLGSFSDFSKFLQKIETSSYLLEVQNITAKEDSVNLTIKVFTR